MTTELTASPEYRRTIDRLEALRHTSEGGAEYWMAREIHTVLGYPTWRGFEAVIERARSSLHANKVEPSHHIVLTDKMVAIGSGAARRQADYFLSRAACSLIVLNGDPSKPEIAAGQAYFVVQTRRMEMEDQRAADEKRLELRDKVKQSHRRVSAVAQEAGLPSRMQGVFHDRRYRGLYKMSLQQVKRKKGLGEKEQLYDRAGPMELSANEFQMNLAADVIAKEKVRGETAVISKNEAVAAGVRRLIEKEGGTLPENLPLAEPISEVRKRDRARKKLAAAASAPSTAKRLPS